MTTNTTTEHVPSFAAIPYQLYSIPFYLGAILLEFVVFKIILYTKTKPNTTTTTTYTPNNTIYINPKATWIRSDLYNLHDTITSISLGATTILVALVAPPIYSTCTGFIHKHLKIATVPLDAVWAWILVFFLADLSYYWAHRCMHTINIMWAGHVPHHSSDYYNLSTALRQGPLEGFLIGFVFTAPWFFLFPPVMIATCIAWNVMQQFWVHTELIRSLGPLEWFLNTPSHHRVHHARNGVYIDKNFAGGFIIWDRLFGTFQAELPEEPVVFGITSGLHYNTHLVAVFHHQGHIIQKVMRVKGLKNKILAIYAGPGWVPSTEPNTGIPEVDVITFKRLAKSATLGLDIYIVVQFLIMVCFILQVLISPRFEYGIACVFFTYILGSLTIFGALCDGWQYAKFCEAARLVLSVGIVYLYIYEALPALRHQWVMSTSISIAYAIISIFALWCVTIKCATPRSIDVKIEKLPLLD